MRKTRRNRKSRMRTKRGGMWPFDNPSVPEPSVPEPSVPEIDPVTGLEKPKGIVNNITGTIGKWFGSSTPSPPNDPSASTVMSPR